MEISQSVISAVRFQRTPSPFSACSDSGTEVRPEEDQLNAPPVALIGYEVWQKHFAGDRSVVGKTIPINGKQVTIIGVMPKGWRFPEVCDIWMPLQMDEKDHPRGNFFLECIGKVKKGVSIEQRAPNWKRSQRELPSSIRRPIAAPACT